MTLLAENMEETNKRLKREIKEQQELLNSLREQLFKQELRVRHLENIHFELSNLRVELLEAKSKLDEKSSLIKHLETTCQQLTEENNFLKYPNSPVVMPPQLNHNVVQFQIPRDQPVVYEEINARKSDFSDATEVLNGHGDGGIVQRPKKQPVLEVPKREPTLAEKLKLTLSQPLQSNEASVSTPKPAPTQQGASSSRVVVKEVTAPKLPKDKTKSLMIRGLYRGLKNDDLIKYFSQFGTIVGITCPPCVASIDDGAKYAFMKFTEYDSVEKAMVQQLHVIKGIKLNTKKAKDFV